MRHCYCFKAGLRSKPHGDRCYRLINNNPCRFESEQRVLAYLMLCDDGLDLVGDLIGPDDFAWPCHRRLFEIIIAMIRAGQSRLADDGAALTSMFDQRGGIPIDDYITTLLLNAPSRITVREYAALMVDHVAASKLKEAA